MNFSDVQTIVLRGESETVEFKKSTRQLGPAGQTLCAFLNDDRGVVIIGVTDDRKIIGQQISDKTRRDVAATLQKFQPPAPIHVHYVEIPGKTENIIVLEARPQDEARPFTFDDRPYQRVETTTSVMPQDRYEAMLLERAHARRRWENQPAVDLSLEHLDHEEILRTRETAISQRRISAGTPMDVAGILDRLGLRRDGVITQAAQVLYGTRFLPDYPQGLLKMGRFRGTKITGDILDNRQEHLHAFAIVREGMAFLDRTLPLSATFPERQIERQDRLAVPPAALREALLNAVMHRDYSDPSSYVAIAVFDNRVEIRSVGSLPRGVTLDALRSEHRSIPRNPLIAETFHRTGAVEIWGRGTNRIAEECEAYGIPPPMFEDVGGALVVTFRAEIGPVGQHGLRPEPGPSRDQVGTKSGPSRDQVDILRLAVDPKPIQDLMDLAGRTNRSKFRDQLLRPLLDDGLLEMTIPDKPTSSRQRYRTTPAGKKLVGTAQ